MSKAQAVKKDKAETDSKTVSVTAAQTKAINGMSTVSAKIRYLDSEGYNRGEIARALGKRYQHVRNVLITPITKARS